MKSERKNIHLWMNMKKYIKFWQNHQVLHVEKLLMHCHIKPVKFDSLIPFKRIDSLIKWPSLKVSKNWSFNWIWPTKIWVSSTLYGLAMNKFWEKRFFVTHVTSLDAFCLLLYKNNFIVEWPSLVASIQKFEWFTAH